VKDGADVLVGEGVVVEFEFDELVLQFTAGQLADRVPNMPPRIAAVAIASTAMIANKIVDAGTPQNSRGCEWKLS